MQISDVKIIGKDVVAVLPVKREADAKSVILLADGQAVRSMLSSATIKRRLEGGVGKMLSGDSVP